MEVFKWVSEEVRQPLSSLSDELSLNKMMVLLEIFWIIYVQHNIWNRSSCFGDFIQKSYTFKIEDLKEQNDILEKIFKFKI